MVVQNDQDVDLRAGWAARLYFHFRNAHVILASVKTGLFPALLSSLPPWYPENRSQAHSQDAARNSLI